MTPRTGWLRRRHSAVVSTLLLLLTLALPGSALAAQSDEPGYRYWGFYTLGVEADQQQWQFAQEGPETLVPDGGDVQGYRFAVVAGEDSRPPRAIADFAQLCPGPNAPDGSKRVGVVIDTGREVDAPEGVQPPAPLASCATVPDEATALQVLQETTEVRRDDAGLVCGIGGYPDTGCGDPVEPVTDAQLAADDGLSLDLPSADTSTESAAPSQAEDPTAGDVEGDGIGDAVDRAVTEVQSAPAFTWLVLLVLLAVVLVALTRLHRPAERTSRQARHQDRPGSDHDAPPGQD